MDRRLLNGATSGVLQSVWVIVHEVTGQAESGATAVALELVNACALV